MRTILAFIALIATPALADPRTEIEAAQAALDRALAELPQHEHSAPVVTGDTGLRSPIVSAFDLKTVVRENGPIAPKASTDEGAMRLACMTSHFSADDPIVFPGQSGKAHTHRFWGNTLTDANSTYETLRTTGGSSCHGREAYRSAGWMPALLDQDGKITPPDIDIIYYKRFKAGSAECTRIAKRCADLPLGLTAIFGSNYATGGAPSPGVRFDCSGRNISRTIPEAMKGCKPGEQMIARIAAPQCWDGKRSAASDHQSHLAYYERSPADGKSYCPQTHPVLIPQISITSITTIMTGDRPTEWRYSSDIMAGVAGGLTYHADYIAAQDTRVEARWHAACIDQARECNDGDLGDGGKLLRPDTFTFGPKPRITALATAPSTR